MGLGSSRQIINFLFSDRGFENFSDTDNAALTAPENPAPTTGISE
jgi:hypothetical protein